MSIARIASTVVVSAALGLGGAGTAALAADMPVKVKAPPAPAVEPLDMHAFFDVSFKNSYITPRGLLVTNTGLTTQILGGIAADVYKDKSGFINLVSFYGYVWNDLWSEQGHPTAGSWNEFDWAVGMTVKFWQNWKFGIEYVEFISPPGNFRIERNAEFTLAYDDSGWWGTSGFALNPYVKLFYNFSGSSTVVVGKVDGSYDVEIGVVPTLDTKKYIGIPLTLSAPTWITVGPKDYWNSGFFNNAAGTGNRGCGGALTLCDSDNAGVFSTGLTGKLALDAWVPARFGKWYAKAGFQYYHIINDNLLLAQTVVGTAATFATAHEDVWVGFGGIGFSF